MTLTTDKGKTFDVKWAWADEALRFEYADARSMREIAGDWEGCAAISRKSEEEGDAAYTGFTRLMSMVRMNNGLILITLGKE